MQPIGMLNLSKEFELYGQEVRDAALGVLDSQQFIGGPAIRSLEEELARRVGIADAVAVSSGTDALLCALMTLEISAGDEVILPSFTFFATAGVVARVGARPVFVDIDPRTFNLDPAKVLDAVTDRTKAIIVVHLFGQCAEMDTINELAEQRGIAVVEDAAQAIGATYHGRSACTLGRIACVSFYPTKNLGGCGEGGMIFTGDKDLADRVRQMRVHGESQRYVHERVGGNFRLDTMKAAILLVKLRYFDEFNAKRRQNARRYNELLESAPVTTPFVASYQEHAFHQYSILCDRRDELAAFLRERQIGTGIYYPVPLHLQKCFASLGSQTGDLPETERICEKILSLPCHPMLTDEEVDRVASGVREFFGDSGSTGSACAESRRCGAAS